MSKTIHNIRSQLWFGTGEKTQPVLREDTGQLVFERVYLGRRIILTKVLSVIISIFGGYKVKVKR
jgi:hypothetical protein